MTRRRIAITGVGMVTPVGNNTADTWTSLQAGRSGLGVIQGFDASGFSSRIGAEVKSFKPEPVIRDRKLLKHLSRSHGFALAAAEEALADAGVRPNPNTSLRWGCSVGAGMMCVRFEELETVHRLCTEDGEFNPAGLVKSDFPADPIAFCRSQSNAGLALLTRHFGIHGYATSVHTACASGGQALGRR